MRRFTTAGIIAFLALTSTASATQTVASSKDSGVAQVPEAVTSWFAQKGASSMSSFLDGEIAESINPDGKAITPSAPVPMYTLTVPGYDLTTGTVTGDVDPAHVLEPTGEYCARAIVGGEPAAAKHCVEQEADGTVEVTGGGEEDFLDGVSWGSVHALLEVRNGLYALSEDLQTLTPVDVQAEHDVGEGRSAGVTDFVTHLARQNAEAQVITAEFGEFGGGFPSIMGTDPEAQQAWEDELDNARTKAAQADYYNHRSPTTASAASPSRTSITGQVVGWAAMGAAILGALAWGLARRRRRALSAPRSAG